ncbi:unnamed protein product [Timema podura]|uniref:Uncharacterized protein n=1 Tax=Timema podura TaxID=61482 RepID=A0ABN7P2L6_TIMPD|nr:unnamed protein product [Timema podura]
MILEYESRGSPQSVMMKQPLLRRCRFFHKNIPMSSQQEELVPHTMTSHLKLWLKPSERVWHPIQS